MDINYYLKEIFWGQKTDPFILNSNQE